MHRKVSKEFKKWHFSLSEDKKTGFVTIKIKPKSPFVAKEWVELIIDEINIFYRQKDKSESEKSKRVILINNYMTNLSEVKGSCIKTLTKRETKKLSLIEARESYVFEYIDPPVVMEKISPQGNNCYFKYFTTRWHASCFLCACKKIFLKFTELNRFDQ